MSCKKDICNPEFKNSLSYIKESINLDDEKRRLNVEIRENIRVLESISGILNKDRGQNILNLMEITHEDIANWEAWISKECDSPYQ